MPHTRKFKKVWIFCFLSILVSAYAHVPHFESKEIRNISISQVHYYEVNNKGSTEVKIFSEGENLYLMFAVPKIERLKDFRPKIKLIAPDGNVIEEFDTASVEPRVYHEEFGDTYEWIYYEKEHKTVKGIYTLIVEYEEFGDTYEWIYYEKEHKTVKGIYTLIVEYNRQGKFWIAVGRGEKFTLMDILSLPVTLTRVRLFHEVFPIVWWGWVLIGLLALSLLGLFRFFQS